MTKSGRFITCFPGDNGNVVCQHPNGSWIVFPGTRPVNENASSAEETLSEDELEEEE